MTPLKKGKKLLYQKKKPTPRQYIMASKTTIDRKYFTTKSSH